MWVSKHTHTDMKGTKLSPGQLEVFIACSQNESECSYVTFSGFSDIVALSKKESANTSLWTVAALSTVPVLSLLFVFSLFSCFASYLLTFFSSFSLSSSSPVSSSHLVSYKSLGVDSTHNVQCSWGLVLRAHSKMGKRGTEVKERPLKQIVPLSESDTKSLHMAPSTQISQCWVPHWVVTCTAPRPGGMAQAGGYLPVEGLLNFNSEVHFVLWRL